MTFINILIEWLYSISLAAGGALMARWLLSYFDRRTGGQFKRWLENADTLSLGIYYGARIIAVCLLFGLALS